MDSGIHQRFVDALVGLRLKLLDSSSWMRQASESVSTRSQGHSLLPDLVTQSFRSRLDGDQVKVNVGGQTVKRAPSTPKHLGWNSFDGQVNIRARLEPGAVR